MYHINRTTDSIDPTGAVDPFAVPAGDLKEPTFPVLREGIYRMEIRSFEEITNDEGNRRLSVKLATTEPGFASDGGQVGAGFPVNISIFLTPGENESIQKVAERAGMLVKAALGGGTRTSLRDCINDPSLLVGKIVNVKLGIREQKKGDYAGTFNNTVKTWIVPGA